MLSSFDFPGWKFSGQRGCDGQSALSTNDEAGSASNLIKAELADLLDDLDDLEGAEEESAHEAAAEHADAHAAVANGSAVVEDGIITSCVAWPDDVLFAVLQSLADSVRWLCVARAVSPHWCEMASSDILWKELWQSHPRLSLRPPREACGSSTLVLPPQKHVHFHQYAVRMRADRCYRWLDLQARGIVGKREVSVRGKGRVRASARANVCDRFGLAGGMGPAAATPAARGARREDRWVSRRQSRN